MLKQLRSHSFLVSAISLSTLVLFVASSARHFFLKSSAFDLGIYDQVVYLMSQGLPPISSFLGFHHLGNHVAFSVYPLAILYKIYASVHWLFLVQAISLSIGAWPIWLLARQAGLAVSLSGAVVIAYLLYPLLFNVNLFDFHPEVMAVPAILFSIWAARADKILGFCVALVFILGCKDALAPLVAAMGVWLILFEKRRLYGWIALIAGSAWFFMVIEWIIPFFSGAEAEAVGRYAYLGDSVLEIFQNIFLKPQLVLAQVFNLATLQYLALLVVPLLWGLSPRHLAPLVAVIPTFAFNILATNENMMSFDKQYSLPILPFLMVAVISTLAAGGGWLRSRRWIILWSLVTFMVLANYGRFISGYSKVMKTLPASQAAIAQVQTKGGVLTDDYLAPHLSQRQTIHLFCGRTFDPSFKSYDYIVTNTRNLRKLRRDCVRQTIDQLKNHPEFQLSYENKKVYVFTRKGVAQSG